MRSMTRTVDVHFCLTLAALLVLAAALPQAGRAQHSSSDGHANKETSPPNIVWITAEDISPDLGAYGTPGAKTPRLDQLAREGVRYTNAFATSGTCSPSRAAIITGMQASSIGAHHMRTRDYKPDSIPAYQAVPPPYVRMVTEYLRAEGYFTTNNAKTDYQFAPPKTGWNVSSSEAHWRDRPDPDQPFFSVFNLSITHSHQIWKRYGDPLSVDSSEIVLPPYYPDIPAVRREAARYHDNIHLMDEQVGHLLDQLEADGLLDKTIVFFFSDHGTSLLRGKRTLYEAGLHVPLIVRFPGGRRAGTVTDRVVSLVDLAPTILSLASVDVPRYMQGQAFLGPAREAPRTYTFAAMDRIGNNYDMIRSARDKRFHYLRNFMPEKPYMQPNEYRDQSAMVRAMKKMHEEGTLDEAQRLYFREQKPVEELYDTQEDPHEINNLVDDPAHQDVLRRMRRATHQWMNDIKDMGFIPEKTMVEELLKPGGQPYQTQAPQFERVRDDGEVKIEITSLTKGASIAYKTEADTQWQLYHEPLSLEEGDVLRAVADRIGFEPSAVVKYESGRGETSR